MVFGDSMYDKYKSGDIIFVRRIESRDDIDYGQCYVVITQEDRYIKNLYESSKGDDYITMTSYNMELNPDGRRKFPDRILLRVKSCFYIRSQVN
jgi:phage repressor protein C with HTH and peptisase S24 domain